MRSRGQHPGPSQGARDRGEKGGTCARTQKRGPASEAPRASAGGPPGSPPRAPARLLPETSGTAGGGVVPGFLLSLVAVSRHRGPHVSLSQGWGLEPHFSPGSQAPCGLQTGGRCALKALLTIAPRKLSRGRREGSDPAS